MRQQSKISTTDEDATPALKVDAGLPVDIVRVVRPPDPLLISAENMQDRPNRNFDPLEAESQPKASGACTQEEPWQRISYQANDSIKMW